MILINLKQKVLIKESYQQINRFIVFKGAMKYQEKIFFTSQDIATTQDAQGAELKSVVNDSKYIFQEETVKKLKL